MIVGCKFSAWKTEPHALKAQLLITFMACVVLNASVAMKSHYIM